ncbi:unnamed protein product [Diplocarpon coronariae]
MAPANRIKPWAAGEQGQGRAEGQSQGRGQGQGHPQAAQAHPTAQDHSRAQAQGRLQAQHYGPDQGQDHGQDQATPESQAPRTVYIYCRPCKQEYRDEASFRAHKIKSPRHVVCDVCFMEFHDDEAKKAHRHAVGASHHGAAQDLTCPHCAGHFTRLGGLIGHLELNECRGLPSAAFDEARKATTEHQDAMRAANRFRDVSRSGNATDEPLPPLRRYDGGAPAGQQASLLDLQAQFDQSGLGGSGSSHTRGSNYPAGLTAPGSAHARDKHDSPLGGNARGNEPIFEDEDLISFTTHAVLGAPWGQTATELSGSPKFTSASSYALNSKSGNAAPLNPAAVPVPVSRGGNVNNATKAFVAVQPSARAPPGNAWFGGSAAAGLFPDVPAAVARPAQVLLPTTSKPVVKDKNHVEVDPNHPGFRVSAFWVAPLSKYKCPLCPKSNPNRNAFIAHLKSPAHRQEQLQCRRCLRYYATATALTQHYESQGVRCTVRETDSFDSVVLGVTANTALTAGRNADDTIKYAINPDVALPAGVGIIAAHRSQQQAADLEFNKYWDTRTPKW